MNQEDIVSQKSQEKPAGNTKTAGPKNQLYRWFFTIPDKEYKASQLSQHFQQFAKKFTFQKEMGESGYVHWQGEVSLKEKLYFEQFKNVLGFHDAHIEPTRNAFAAANYCGKDDTRLEGPYTEKTEFEEELYTPPLTLEWQFKYKDILLEKPDYRKIYWIWGNTGNQGKTDFCLHMLDKHGASVYNNGKFADIAFALPKHPKIVLFDLPRDLEERVNYTAIECIKNGFIFSGKYESGGKRFNKPHVAIFANFPPEMDRLSLDRWDIICLDDNSD